MKIFWPPPSWVLYQISPLWGFRDRVAILNSSQLAQGFWEYFENLYLRWQKRTQPQQSTYLDPKHTNTIVENRFLLTQISLAVTSPLPHLHHSQDLVPCQPGLWVNHWWLRELHWQKSFWRISFPSLFLNNSSLELSHTCSAHSGKQTLGKCFPFWALQLFHYQSEA